MGPDYKQTAMHKSREDSHWNSQPKNKNKNKKKTKQNKGPYLWSQSDWMTLNAVNLLYFVRFDVKIRRRGRIHRRKKMTIKIKQEVQKKNKSNARKQT